MVSNRVVMLATQLSCMVLVGMANQSLVAPSYAQQVVTTSSETNRDARRITVNIENAPLVKALHTIAEQAGLVVAFNEATVPSLKRVTLHAQDITVNDAFVYALNGTALTARVHEGTVAIVRAIRIVAVPGAITGRVLDSGTKQPLSHAKITIDGNDHGVETDPDGTYRLSGITAGSHTIIVRRVGYVKQSRTVSVNDDAIVAMDFSLDPSVNMLNQVVVTGTVIPTELKAVPNAITVITAKQIEERGITKIDQLFRGDVPGVFAANYGSSAFLDEVTMFSRGATSLSSISAGTGLGTNPIKTYIDGVELADPKYLSQIDPRSIERIEILTGPQASTIYGSNAINGVMQIFTKRGTTSRPQLTLNLLSGWVENDFNPAHTPQHDYSAQVSDVEGRLSYNIGGGWNYVGPWTPAKQSTRTNAFGGARLDVPMRVGGLRSELSLRRNVTQAQSRGSQLQVATKYYESGWWFGAKSPGVTAPTTRQLIGQTTGGTLSYTPVRWWSHEAEWGRDGTDTETRRTMRGYTSISDTSLRFDQSHAERRSVRYATTLQVPVGNVLHLSLTGGGDAWQSSTASWSVSPQTLSGSLIGATTVSRRTAHNTGAFVQAQFGLSEQFFATYGLRAEWNPGFGADAEPNMTPRYGVAYTRELGSLSAKLRWSYGRATRPPDTGLKTAATIIDLFGSAWPSAADYYLPYYGRVFDYRKANPDLAPEHQDGMEEGVELYFGSRASLIVTAYDQTVRDLIAQPPVDSVRTLIPCPTTTCGASSRDVDGYGYFSQNKFLNIGTIRNQGWELQGSLNTGPITTRGTYSWTRSRTVGVNPKYQGYFADQPQYYPGATFSYLPEHTYSLNMTYSSGTSMLGVVINGAGQIRNDQNDLILKHIDFNVRLLQNHWNVRPAGFVNTNAGYVMADLTASHRMAGGVESILYIQNLTDAYHNDINATYSTIGRQVKIGIRFRTR